MSKSSDLRPDRSGESSSDSGKQSLGDKVSTGINKLGGPLNRLSNKLGREAWWPTALTEECNKATRILTSFCKNECYTEQLVAPGSQQPKANRRF
ncbi:hypothetical protein NW765_017545 [Fusarium oxysporum]|nr:hypothetical protein NW765_017548 [Fusarium oxysporum]KAJ4168242.1 hypothetical protein NW765_017545 [Fusarium oxysporum]KAJ4263703.1 hypothetical protein NW764_016085 [Fusarium oxysporum]